MKTRKMLTTRQLKNYAALLTFGTLGIVLFMVAVNWHVAVGIFVGFLAGWIAANYWSMGNKPTLLYERQEIPEKPRPTRDTIREWQSKN